MIQLHIQNLMLHKNNLLGFVSFMDNENYKSQNLNATSQFSALPPRNSVQNPSLSSHGKPHVSGEKQSDVAQSLAEIKNIAPAQDQSIKETTKQEEIFIIPEPSPRPFLIPPSPAKDPRLYDSAANDLVVHDMKDQISASKIPGSKIIEPPALPKEISQNPVSNAHSNKTHSSKAHSSKTHWGEGLWAVDLGKKYKKRPVLQNVSMHVQRGESVGLLGPNGAGKTTSFYIISGLIGADSGKVYIDGVDVTRLPMYRRARLGVGYLPQEPSIFRGLSVEDNMLAVLEVLEPNRKKRRIRMEELLQEFSIEHLRKSPSVALSGGERRRLEIARALASNPHFILLDEPFAGVDPIAVRDIRELVVHLKARGIGVLITDHNVRNTLEVVDRAYILHEGHVFQEGTPYEIISNPEVRRVYLGDQFNENDLDRYRQ